MSLPASHPTNRLPRPVPGPSRRPARHPHPTAARQARAAACSASAAASISGPASSFSFSQLGAFLGFAVVPFAQNTLRRLFGRRRAKRRAMPTAGDATRATFSVATFNLRGVMDRWVERQPLLRQCLQQIDADVLCFQECLTGAWCVCVSVWER